MSILAHIHQNPDHLPPKVDFLYGHRQSGKAMDQGSATDDSGPYEEPALFLQRLTSLFASEPFTRRSLGQNRCRMRLFLTQSADSSAKEPLSKSPISGNEDSSPHVLEQFSVPTSSVPTEHRRITQHDFEDALNGMDYDQRKGVVAYVCGPPSMTDWAVEILRYTPGVVRKRVLCEKWW